MLQLKLRRVGSSLGVIVPKKDLDEAGLQEGDLIFLPRIAAPARKELYGVWRTRPVRLYGDE